MKPMTACTKMRMNSPFVDQATLSASVFSARLRGRACSPNTRPGCNISPMVAVRPDVFADLLAHRPYDTFLPPVPVKMERNGIAPRNDEKVVPFVHVYIVHGSSLSTNIGRCLSGLVTLTTQSRESLMSRFAPREGHARATASTATRRRA